MLSTPVRMRYASCLRWSGRSTACILPSAVITAARSLSEELGYVEDRNVRLGLPHVEIRHAEAAGDDYRVRSGLLGGDSKL